MNRRHLIQFASTGLLAPGKPLALASSLGAALAMTTSSASSSPASSTSSTAGVAVNHVRTLGDLANLPGLKPSPRMPVVFLGHGSPMNVLERNRWFQGWADLGQQFGNHPGARYPKPQLILAISAHWITRGWAVTGMAMPPTIHDFGGFPQALYEMHYHALGAPDTARALAASLPQPHTGQPLLLDEHQWGLDHGTWGVLLPMFPAADIPVVQLSIDYSRPPAEHLALGRQLRALREQGVLIVGSGNTVHNLHAMARNAKDNEAYDWAIEFDTWAARHATRGDAEALTRFADLGEAARLSHPTYDHFLPLLYNAGAAYPDEPVSFFNEGFQLGSVGMRSMVWG